MSRLTNVFETDRTKLNMKGGVAVGAVLFVLWFVIIQTNQQKYLITVVFAVLMVALSDPGAHISHRVKWMSVFAAIGALVTVFGFSVGGRAWGYIVLAVSRLPSWLGWRSNWDCIGSRPGCCSTFGSWSCSHSPPMTRAT